MSEKALAAVKAAQREQWLKDYDLVKDVLDIAMRADNLTLEEKDKMATVSYLIGSDHYQKLGFSAVPDIVEPPPATDQEVAKLFEDK